MDTENEWRVHPVFTKYSGHPNGLIKNDESGKELKGHNCNSQGYRRLQLSYNSAFKHCYLHVFVFECFNGFVDSTVYAIDHIDGDNTNNKLSNLQKLSHSDHSKKTVKSNPDAQKKGVTKLMKAVIRIELDTQSNEIERRTFSSINEAAKYDKSSAGSIIDACNKKRETLKWITG